MTKPFLNRVIGMLLAFSVFIGCSGPEQKVSLVKGIYGNPKPLWEKGYELSEMGVNAIFVHSGSINQAMVERAREDDLQVFAEFATLNGKSYVQEHPEAWAINELGERVEAASWFMGVCPTEPGFRNYRFGQLRELMTKFDLDGLWMDYVHWHAQFEEPEPILPETCFCDHCLSKFSEEIGIQLPEGTTTAKASFILEKHDAEWRNWRCQVIAGWAKDMKQILNEIKPDALLGLYHCPWNDVEFDGARQRILGLDYDLLKGTIDVFSPMVYHGRMGRKPEWVKENIEWFSDELSLTKDSKPKVWPIVQAYNDPYVIDAAEFKQVMQNGLAGSSTGIMMFTTYAVAEDPTKVDVLRKIYLK